MRKPSNRILVLCFAVLVATAAVYLSVHSTVAPPIPDGDYSIRSRSTNLVVDDPFSSRNSGEQMIRWDWNNGLNQKWHFAYQGRGYYTIQNMKSGLFLTDPGGPTERSVPLQQQKARNDDSQMLYSLPSSLLARLAISAVGTNEGWRRDGRLRFFPWT